jgi:transcriptional regulator with XRE-family HTH domain
MKPDQLKNWREKNGYSQARLAKVLGIDIMTVSRWERGTNEAPAFLKMALSYLEMQENQQKCKKRMRKGGE